ncbi:MAG: DUF1801 domain-containing protein [Chitinophagales bacterium]
MSVKDPRIDVYISSSTDFAKPVLLHLRKIIHKACPGVEETVKWNMPYFMYKGILCSMASFKSHCAFTLWKGNLLKDPEKILDVNREKAMGQFGRITTVRDLPSEKILITYIQEAMRLNDDNVRAPANGEKERK